MPSSEGSAVEGAPSTLVHSSWQPLVAAESSKAYFITLQKFVAAARASSTVYPPPSKVFAALAHTPLLDVRVVIVGQDPYHGPGQANGLAFSVSPGIAPPPSLRNMLQEAGVSKPMHGDLTAWARQGVLLLNTVLTVERGSAFAHAKRGWETFTGAVLRAVVERCTAGGALVVFLLWGKPAQEAARAAGVRDGVGGMRVLASPHPSPLSAYRGFIGSRPFDKANALLKEAGLAEIKWTV